MPLSFVLLFAILIPMASLAKGSSGHKGTVHVKGHTTKNGNYVSPHKRTAPDHSKSNNWSAKGNVNPYTGKEGTKD